QLRYGLPVSSAEVNDALVTPPRHLSPTMRAQLVQQLKSAQALDDKRSQEILVFLPTDEPAERTQFDIQSHRASEVAKSLQIGESVNWSTIQQALYVPPEPL
ncbi:MAG TPA: hypothetical protein VKR29_08275, partial [Candidatus Binataceae bacterium]|nr:hypothetical protein [Candidatus Binataceae bacterium]